MATNSLRADALLIYLCLSGEVIHTRESLACLLWEDADPKHSMGSLRQLIRKVRLAAPELENFIDFGRSQITVEKEAISSDLDLFRESFETKSLQEVPKSFDFIVHEILLNFVGISGYFDSWIAVLRNHIDSSLRDTLNQVLLGSAGSPEIRNYAARMLMLFDPTNEPACCYLMRAYAVAGNQASALQLYNSLYELLGDEYDAEPSEETQALVAQIKLGEIPRNITPAVPLATLSANILPSIYVTEFELDSTDRNLGNFIRVFRQELFVNLSTFREWRLFDAEPVAGDGYTFEGLAGQVGGDVYFIATLKLAPDNRIVWSERFSIDFATWGTVQRDIAKRISLAVNVGISLDRLNQRLTTNLSDQNLFDKWLLAQSYVLEWDPKKLQSASKLLDEILDAAPDFASARSSRANIETIRHLNLPGHYRSADELHLGNDHAKHALKIDPLDARAHLAMGWSLAMRDQHDAGLLYFETCRELNPSSTLCSLACALGLAFAGQTFKASSIVDETLSRVRNIPPYLWGYVQNIRFLENDLESAIFAGDRAGDAIINLPAWQAAALWEAGDFGGATRVAADFAKLSGLSWQSSVTFDHLALTDWFVSCFPLKDQKQRQRLRSALGAALVATETTGGARIQNL